ncbi:hypothetical protein HKX48_008946 [Thoreauomyces humboldtii]|nr:hypothetical protein HKX48_008946 [Thoreauomyces humboldtii]
MPEPLGGNKNSFLSRLLGRKATAHNNSNNPISSSSDTVRLTSSHSAPPTSRRRTTNDLHRAAYAAILADPREYASFRHQLADRPDCVALMAFRDGYARLHDLLSAIAAGVAASSEDREEEHEGSDDGERVSEDRSTDSTATIPIPPWLGSLLLRFTETFVQPGGTDEIKLLSSAARKQVAVGMEHVDQNRVRATVLDLAASEVDEALYRRWHAEVIVRREEEEEERFNATGNTTQRSASAARAAERTHSDPSGRSSLDAATARRVSHGTRNREPSFGSDGDASDIAFNPTSSPSSSPTTAARSPNRWRALTMLANTGKPRKSSSSSSTSSSPGTGSPMARGSSADQIVLGQQYKQLQEPVSYKYEYTRDSFVRLLFDPEAYADFVAFARETLCLENILFYEAIIRLELSIADSLPQPNPLPSPTTTGLTRSLTRFLENNAVPTTYDPDRYTVPTACITTLMILYTTFLMPQAQHEVNISHALRKAIAGQLRRDGDGDGEVHVVAADEEAVKITVFDAAVDEILDMLYRNTYALFLKMSETPEGVGRRRGRSHGAGSGPRPV